MVHVTEIPNQLGSWLGVSVTRDEYGACRVLFDDDAVDFQPAGSVLFLVSDLGSALSKEEENSALLRANCCGAETLGAVIGLDAERQMLTMHMMLTGSMEEEEFDECLSAFLKAVRYWKAWVAVDPSASKGEKPAMASETQSGVNGFLAV